MKPKLTIDDKQFRGLLIAYMEIGGKELSNVLNSKSYFIVKKAIRLTRKADKGKIRRWATWNAKNADRLRAFTLKHAPELKTDADRKAYFKKVKSARVKSVAYLKSGWLPALKAFGRVTRMSRKAKGVVARGRPKGFGKWAKKGFSPKASFANKTGHKSTRKAGQKYSQEGALKKYGSPALSRAFSAEARSMKRYMERKMQAIADRLGMGAPGLADAHPGDAPPSL